MKVLTIKSTDFFNLTSEVSLNSFFYEVLIFDRIKYLKLYQKMEKNLKNMNGI